MQNIKSIYENKTLSIYDILEAAREKKLAIPAIQRPYVWQPAQLARYVDSLMHGWPCGSLLFWNTSRQNVFTVRKFAKEYCTDEAQATKEDLQHQIVGVDGSEEIKYELLVLDGQQRIQSLMLAFAEESKGYLASTKEWKFDIGETGGKRNEVVRKHLCFNLKGWSKEYASKESSYFYRDEIGDEFALCWSTEEEIKNSNGCIVRLNSIPAISNDEMQEWLSTPTNPKEWLFAKINFVLRNVEIPIMIVNDIGYDKNIQLTEDDTIVQIFTRLNTAGTPLTTEQIQAARVKNYWDKFSDRIEDFRERLIKQKCDLGIDDLVKGFNLMLRAKHGNSRDSMLKVYQRVNDKGLWEKEWEEFCKKTLEVFQALDSKSIVYKSEYKSLYIIWFSVAALARYNAEIENDKLLQIIVKFAFVTTWARVWANLSKTFVDKFLKTLCDGDCNSAAAWFASCIGDEKLSKLAKDFIDALSVNHRNSVRHYYSPLWIWMRLKKERTELLTEFDAHPASFDVDHLVPYDWVKSTDFRTIFNNIGNCWILSSSINRVKSAASFPDFLNESSDVDIHHVCANICADYNLLCHAEKPDDTILRGMDKYISMREKQIKSDLKNYVEDCSSEIYFPNMSVKRTRAANYERVYRGRDFIDSCFDNLADGTINDYISHVNTAMRSLNISKNDIIDAAGMQMTNNEARQYFLPNDWKEKVGQRQQSIWEKYVCFIFNLNNGVGFEHNGAPAIPFDDAMQIPNRPAIVAEALLFGATYDRRVNASDVLNYLKSNCNLNYDAMRSALTQLRKNGIVLPVQKTGINYIRFTREFFDKHGGFLGKFDQNCQTLSEDEKLKKLVVYFRNKV